MLSGKMYRFRVDERFLDPRYVEGYLNSHSATLAIDAIKTGISDSGLNLTHDRFRQLPFPLPPVAEQRRIVAVTEEQFSRLDAAVSAFARVSRRLEVLRQRVLDTAFGLSPEARPLEVFLREPLRNGRSARAATDGSGVRTLTLTAVTRREFTDAHTKPAAVDPEKIGDLWLKSGDVLVQRSNTPELVGSAALYRGPDRWAIFPDLLIRVRTTEDLMPEYLDLYLQSLQARDFLRRRAQGLAGSMPKIDQRAVADLPIPFRTPEEQRSIVVAVDRQLSVIDSLRTTVELARKRAGGLRHAILERACRGELVPQDPDDEPASMLLERIRSERAAAPKPKRRKRVTA
jgi:type I restriction enzyme S subunit